jgi:hypothetical protein
LAGDLAADFLTGAGLLTVFFGDLDNATFLAAGDLVFLTTVFLRAAFFGVAFFGVAFFGAAFFGVAFFAVAFFGVAFFGVALAAFLTGDFLTTAFFAGEAAFAATEATSYGKLKRVPFSLERLPFWQRLSWQQEPFWQQALSWQQEPFWQELLWVSLRPI